MADKPQGFMHIDLTKLTLIGWLMMLLTIAIVLGVAIGIALLLESLAGSFAGPDGRRPRWVAALILIPAVGVGAAFFEGGRRLLNRVGWPLMREADADNTRRSDANRER